MRRVAIRSQLRFLRARSAAELTQAQLAERLKTDQGNIARLERGRTQATIRTLKRIAEAQVLRADPRRITTFCAVYSLSKRQMHISQILVTGLAIVSHNMHLCGFAL